MYNKTILAGNLTRDIELKYHNSTAIATVGIATNRKFKSQSGEQKEEVLFIDLTLFGRTAEVINQYCKKGSKVLIEGRLKLDQWQDQNGNKRSKHSVTVETLQMLDNKTTNADARDNQQNNHQSDPTVAVIYQNTNQNQDKSDPNIDPPF